jgi:hypothetical protein
MLEDYLFTHSTRWILWTLAALVIAALIFLAGMSFGERRVRHERDETTFASSFLGGLPLPNGFITRGHGAVGTVMSVSAAAFTLKERDGDTVDVTLASTTPRSGTSTIATGEFVVVIGDPTTTPGGAESIDARFVRILHP